MAARHHIISPYTGEEAARVLTPSVKSYPEDVLRQAANAARECREGCVEIHYCGCSLRVSATPMTSYEELRRQIFPELQQAYESKVKTRTPA